MTTPHNEANVHDIADTVLMPGDPLRAKFIADTYIKDVHLFNTVRNMFGYTGTYKGKRVSIMGSGMGMPSIGIYSYELYKFYGVERILRIGSAGAYSEQLALYDLVLATSAWSESTYACAQAGDDKDVQYPDKDFNAIIIETAKQLQQPLVTGCIHSSDVFYHEDCVASYQDFLRAHGCICVEMESFALFHNARILGKKAACLLTISDSLVTQQATTPQQRQTSFQAMLTLALESTLQ